MIDLTFLRGTQKVKCKALQLIHYILSQAYVVVVRLLNMPQRYRRQTSLHKPKRYSPVAMLYLEVIQLELNLIFRLNFASFKINLRRSMKRTKYTQANHTRREQAATKFGRQICVQTAKQFPSLTAPSITSQDF